MADEASDHWVGELRKLLPARVETSVPLRDFGGPLGPARVEVCTRTQEELSALLQFAAQHQVPVACRGARHSSGGHIAAPGGISLSHRPPRSPLRVQGAEVELPAQLSWAEVEAELHQQGLDLPVATSSLETTVAGTLSAGGFGVRSISRGPQVDHVQWLELVCADGKVRRCSLTQERELFLSALTGLGQVGVVERVGLRAARRLGCLALSERRYASFAALGAELLWLEDCERADLPGMFCALLKEDVLGAVLGSAYASAEEASAACGRPPRPWAGELRPVAARDFEAGERAMPEWWKTGRNLWCDYCFRGPEFREFCRFVDVELRHTLRGHLAYVLCSQGREGDGFALDMRPANGARGFSLGLFYSLEAGDEAGVQRAHAAHRLALRECLRLGGRPYLYGVWGGRDGLTRDQLGAVFGAGYERLRRVRSALDPSGVLNASALS